MISVIILLITLLIIQVIMMAYLKKLITNLNTLSKELKASQKRLEYKFKTKDFIAVSSLKKCQNCAFRQTFVKTASMEGDFFFYRCIHNGTEITLDDSCSKFHFESTKFNS